MWKAYMKCDITLGIGVCPATIKVIAMPLAISSQSFQLWLFVFKHFYLQICVQYDCKRHQRI